jgi:two-component system OmpR family sensor kinase
VDAVMRAHGGEVTVASELGKGATFTLHFKN